MQNFQVPQFIEIEDKIFGPFSFKQFIYLAGGIALAFVFYVIPVPLFLKIIPIIVAVVFGMALAFYHVNDRPFILTLQSALKFLFSKKLYLWKKTPGAPAETKTNDKTVEQSRDAFISKTRLKDLGWSLDIKEKTR